MSDGPLGAGLGTNRAPVVGRGSRKTVRIMSKSNLVGGFVEEAKAAFDFLRDSGFVGPEVHEYGLYFSTGTVGVEVLFDEREGRVVTLVQRALEDWNAKASLQCLYVAAGLGPAQDIRSVARSRKLVAPAVNSHARALRKLLPVVREEDNRQLLRDCHGR